MTFNADILVVAIIESGCCGDCMHRYIRLLEKQSRPARQLVEEVLTCTPQQREEARSLLLESARVPEVL